LFNTAIRDGSCVLVRRESLNVHHTDLGVSRWTELGGHNAPIWVSTMDRRTQ
jgi:hypothetical protein